MDLPATFTLIAAAAALCLASLWGDHVRRRAPLGRVAHMPWHALMFIGLTALAVGVAHLLTLLRA